MYTAIATVFGAIIILLLIIVLWFVMRLCVKICIF